MIEINFKAVKKYCERFQNIFQFYQEDMEFDENLIRDNIQVDIFRKWCERYRSEEQEIENIGDFESVGIFCIYFDRFKSFALNAPYQKKTVLAEVMPR